MNGRRQGVRAAALSIAMLCAPAAAAQDDERPVVTPDVDGTTIIGERDTAVGLFVSPWREQAASALDRAPGPYDVPMEPVEIERFRRLADYDRVSRDYERERWLNGR